jgi:CRP-like cAMP-binding protein
VEERFFLFLKKHYENSLKIILPYSKKDIAAAIGTTPETYSRLIARLAKEGKIAVEGKSIEIFKAAL